MFLCWLEWQGLWRGENIRHCGEGDGGKVRDQWWSCGISQDYQRLWHGHDRSKRWVKSFVLKERFINTKATSNGIKKEWTFKEHSKMILSSIMKHWFEFIEIKNSSIEWCMNHDLSNPMFCSASLGVCKLRYYDIYTGKCHKMWRPGRGQMKRAQLISYFVCGNQTMLLVARGRV